MKSESSTAFDPYHLWLQVPKDARPPNHYQLLGLSIGEANEDVIRQATLMRSAYVRHFQNGPNAADSTRILEELAEASRVLLDPQLRAEYQAKVKPVAAKPQAKISAGPPLTIPKPKTSVPDYELANDADRRHKKKKGRRHRRNGSLVGTLLGLIFVGAGLGAIAYIGNAYFRNPSTTKASTDLAAAGTAAKNVEPEKSVEQPKKDAPRPRPPDAAVVRLSVEPPTAELKLEAIGDTPANGPKAIIEGEGGERTIVAEKGSLPLVVAGTAPGFQPTRVTVFSSDAGRLVVVQLLKESGRNLLAENSRPLPSDSKRRVVGGWRVGIPISTKDQKHSWKYAVNRPAYDWASPTFGDVLWTEGEGAFGTRVGKNAVKAPGLWLRTNWASREIWLRTRVDLPPEIKTARIRWTYRNDNILHVHVNGVYQFSDRTSNFQPTTRVMDATGFQAGENVIGVHCSNTGGPGLVDLGFEWIATEEIK
jgi:hypothetical protein